MNYENNKMNNIPELHIGNNKKENWWVRFKGTYITPTLKGFKFNFKFWV